MNLKPLIFTFPFLITGCVQVLSSGYSESINPSTFFLPKLDSFMYCGNTFFESSAFINRVNLRHKDFPSKVVAITSLQDIEGPEYNASVQAPMKCKATFIFADNHKETGVMKVSVYNQYYSYKWVSSPEERLDIKWNSNEQIAERSKKIAELKRKILEDESHPSYKCIYLSVDSAGVMSHRTGIVADRDDCGSNPSELYYSDPLNLRGQLRKLEKEQ